MYSWLQYVLTAHAIVTVRYAESNNKGKNLMVGSTMYVTHFQHAKMTFLPEVDFRCLVIFQMSALLISHVGVWIEGSVISYRCG